MDNVATGTKLGSVENKPIDNKSISLQVEYNNENGEKVKSEAISSELENITIKTSKDEFNEAYVDITATTPDNLTTTTVNTLIKDNGTMLNQIVITGINGKEVKATIGSLLVGANLDIKQDGSVELSLNDVKSVIHPDGRVSHTVVKDGKITEASSNIPDSTVVILENGTVQTKGVIEDDNKKIEIVVDGTVDGKALHILKVIDKATGDEKISKAYSELSGATTSMNEDGTVVTSYENSRAETDRNGFMTHVVEINGVESLTTMQIAGAETRISENRVTTTAEMEDNGNKLIVVVETDENVENISYFKRVDENGAELNKQDTTKTKISKGAKYDVTLVNGKPTINIKTKMTIDEIEF